MGSTNNQMYSPRRRDGDAVSSAAPDSAFEPHSGFMFEEEPAPDAEEFNNMQRNIASFNALNNSDSGFQSMSSMQ